jgi:hypothetical protein
MRCGPLFWVCYLFVFDMYSVIILDKNNRDCMLIKMTLSFCWQVTTPDDLLVAERILHQTAPKEVVKAVSS